MALVECSMEQGGAVLIAGSTQDLGGAVEAGAADAPSSSTGCR